MSDSQLYGDGRIYPALMTHEVVESTTTAFATRSVAVVGPGSCMLQGGRILLHMRVSLP